MSIGRELVIALSAVALAALAGGGEKAANGFQGYAEGEFVLIAAPAAGKLEKRWVNRGEEVAAGAPLFALEDENEKAGRREAEERLRNSQAKLANIVTGKRKPEIDAITAQEGQAAACELSERQLKQQKSLPLRVFSVETGAAPAGQGFPVFAPSG